MPWVHQARQPRDQPVDRRVVAGVRGIPKTKALIADLPPCWGQHDEMNAVCAECIIEMSCEVYRRLVGGSR